MTALILAAGIASRLRPLTEHTPKCLLDIGGRSILARTVDNLLLNGIRDYVIVTGYLDHMIREHMAMHYPDVPVRYIHNADFASTNNIYSLWLAREALADREMLLLDSDILFDAAIPRALLDAPHADCAAVNMAAVGEEEIKVRLDGDGRILDISKIVPIAEAAGESIGIERFSRRFAAALFAETDRMIRDEGLVNVFYEAAFERVIHAGEHNLYAVDVSAWPCMELDTIADVEHARSVLLPRLS